MRSLKVLLPPVVLLLLAGCGEDDPPRLVGKWELIDPSQPATIEFRADGRYRATTHAGVLEGEWELLDGNRIATWTDDAKPKRVSRFDLRDDELLIGSADGAAHVHRRTDR